MVKIKKRFGDLDLLEALDFIRLRTNEGRSLSIDEFAKEFHTFKEAAVLILNQLVARNCVDYKYRPLDKFKKKPVPEYFACDTIEWEARC